MDRRWEEMRNQIIGLGEDSHRKSYYPVFRQSEEALRAVFDATYDAIMIHTPEGLLVEANKSMLSLYGVTHEQALTFSIKDYSSPSADPEMAAALIRKALGGDRNILFEWEARRPLDGSTFPVEVTLRPLEWRGSPHLVAVIRDIGPRRKAQELIQHQLKELEMKGEELERFNYTISHDLKGPLVTIQGFSGMLEKDLAQGRMDLVKDDLTRIGKAVGTMNNHLNSLLEFSKIIRNFQAIPDCSMEKALDRSLKYHRSVLEGLQCQPQVLSSLPGGYFDPQQMSILWTNLLDNAVKYRREGVPLEIRAGWDSSRRCYFLEDNGVGIPERFHQKIFGLFEKLNPASPGPGIGLALGRRIVLQHGGNLWVEDPPGGVGSRFCFTLGRGPGILAPQDPRV